ncbi:MAG: amidohydrolase [Actinobacteria bacterium]|nr:amidohydrolase [Actinomycetota bacterium]
MDRYVVISSDGHVTARPEDYTPYLEGQYQQIYAESLQVEVERQAAVARLFETSDEEHGAVFAADAVAARKSHELAYYDGALTDAQWDSDLRTRMLEDQGVVAEVLFSNATPFVGFDEMFGRSGRREHVAAGKRAYNRWLADFCAQLPGRRAGIAQLDLDDVDDAVREATWAANAGLKGVTTGQEGEFGLLYDERYDRLWAVLAEAGLSVAFHGGAVPPHSTSDVHLAFAFLTTETLYWSRRPLWLLIWGGVLERHPALRVVFTEQRSEWVPRTIATLDGIYNSRRVNFRSLVPRPPSEYWARQCFVGASLLTAEECALRNAIGPDKLMFGADFPHMEGTWPRTSDWLEASVGGLPEDDIRAILSANAAAVYGFDLARLQALADRVGPTVEALATRGRHEDLDMAFKGEP